MKRFLVTHDYGMGSLWWWIEAPSAEAIIQTYAEVMIVEPADGETERFADIPSLRIGDPAPAGLDDLEEQRRVQRASPKFGALVGRGSVYIRKDYPEEQEIYFFEYDEQGIARGRLLCRRVARRNGPEDWLFNPPEDLWDPELAECEIAREEFEGWWGNSRTEHFAAVSAA